MTTDGVRTSENSRNAMEMFEEVAATDSRTQDCREHSFAGIACWATLLFQVSPTNYFCVPRVIRAVWGVVVTDLELIIAKGGDPGTPKTNDRFWGHV